MRRLGILLIASSLAVILGVSFMLAGCGSADEGSTSTYADSQYGFAFDYPSDWQLTTSGVIRDSVGGAATAEVIAVDPDGAMSGDVGLDLVTVRVYALDITVDESMLPDVLAFLQSSVDELAAGDPTVQIEEPLAETVVGGIKGHTITYTFDWPDGTRLQSTSYYLFDGALEYELIVQATLDNWEANQDAFAAFVASFDPNGGTESTAD